MINRMKHRTVRRRGSSSLALRSLKSPGASFVVVLGTIMGLSAQVASAADLEVTADRDRVYLGEAVMLTVKVSGSQHAEPNMGALTNCGVRLRDSQSQSYHHVIIRNGRREESGFTGRVYTYEVTPIAAGPFAAGPVTATVDGRTVTARGPVIEVQGIEKQDWVRIEVVPSSEAVLVDEPFDITLNIHLKRLPKPYAHIDPIASRDPPGIKVDYLEIKDVKGLRLPDLNAILSQRVAGRGEAGFTLNNYTARPDMFSFPGTRSQRKLLFKFDRTEIEKDGQEYFQYSLKLRYTPSQEGSYTFGPVTFKGNIISGVTKNQRPRMSSVFAVGPASTVRVVPPPEDGRPDSYIGAVGTNLTATAELDAQTCNVGDPLKLTIEIAGNISFDNVYPPTLGSRKALARDFRVVDDAVRASRGDGRIEYEYTIRPLKSGPIELPPIDVSYYDIRERAYKTVATQPLPLQVRQSEEIGAGSIIDTVTNRNGRTGTDTHGPLTPAPAIMNATVGAEVVGLTGPWWYLLIVAAGPLVFGVFIAVRAGTRGIRQRNEARLGQRAAPDALAALRAARREAKDRPDTAGSEIFAILRKYLAERFQVSEAGLTPADAARLIRDSGAAQEVADGARELLERCFNTGYSPSEHGEMGTGDDFAEAERLVAAVEEDVPRISNIQQGMSNR